MRTVKNVLIKTQVVAFTGLVATLMLPAAPASAQSKIPDSEMSYCAAKLTGQTPGSRINLRSGPGTNYQQNGYGVVGDSVHILQKPGGTPRDLASPRIAKVRHGTGLVFLKVALVAGFAKTS
jgi:hypothetical protein